MSRINLNNFAREVAKQEGLKKSQNIAQIKETIRIVLRELSWYLPSQVMELIERDNAKQTNHKKWNN